MFLFCDANELNEKRRGFVFSCSLVLSPSRDGVKGGSKVRKRKENFKSCVFFKNSIVEARERREREGWLDALKTVSDWVPF